MTKLELIYNVREKLKIHSDDSNTTDEFISHLIDVKRVFVLEQRLGGTAWKAPIEVKQELKMDLEVVDSVDGMECFGTILRTAQPLPNLVRSKGGNSGITVRRADRKFILIDLIGLDRLPFAGEGRFVSQLTYAAFDYDNRLYLVSGSPKHLLLKSIFVGGIYEDTVLAGDLDPSTDLKKDIWDREYPLTMNFAEVAVDLVVKDLIRSMKIPQDIINDAESPS